MAHPSVSMPDSMLEEIDNQAGRYDRSGWFREAAEFRLVVGYIDDAHANELPDEWWLDALGDYIDERDAPARIEA